MITILKETVNLKVCNPRHLNHTTKKSIRKHLKYDTWGMLLPVPQSRKEKYEGGAVNQRRFVIELYFKDDILKNEDMLGEEIAQKYRNL